MARKSVETKNINGVLYYTSTYFANEVFVNKREARAFLEDFNSLKGHTNPRLYDKNTMEKAISSYKNGYRTKDIFDKKIQDILINQEIQRASAEGKNYLTYLENFDQITENAQLKNDIGHQMEVSARSAALKKFETDLTNTMLKHLLYLQGYEFDEEKYLNDLILNEGREIVRDDGDERDLEHILALKRLSSSNSYLKKV
ncbi:TPA: hypothetical protein ACGO8I_000240 [Streptococcus suis]|uniref:hypothetical protein n=1 Tax=Streptococcus suis TaxID=1307 RepID=UPI001ABE2D00|nr:hypothetical protein [Streptococcus suis]MBO4130851.1 hypothetical protein [Streptococcus suis]HEO8607575.1 hypothetical protein [Streptococcus suis]HEO8609478.1 hypothetical protein [Streptococcus suis]